MEIICVICKHTDRTEEQRERHVQTAEHIRNDEIYTMGLEHSQQYGKKQVATLEARIKELEATLESVDALVSEGMGEWYGVEFAHLPASMANIAHIRDILSEVTK